MKVEKNDYLKLLKLWLHKKSFLSKFLYHFLSKKCKWVVAKRIFLFRQSSIIIWSFEGARLSRSVRVFLKMDDLNSSRIFWSNPISLLELNLDKRLGNEEPTHPFIKKAHLKKCCVYVNVTYFHFTVKVFFFLQK